MRNFESGATRDNDTGKLDYEGFLSPLVLKRYAEYLNKHRTQSDGKLRDSDNWQGLFGEKHFDVCMKSALRHFVDWWMEHREGSGSETGIEEAICAVMFNAQAYLFKILKDNKAAEEIIKKYSDCIKPFTEKKAKTDSALVICNNPENCWCKRCSHSKPHKLGTASSSCVVLCGNSGGKCEKVKED